MVRVETHCYTLTKRDVMDKKLLADYLGIGFTEDVNLGDHDKIKHELMKLRSLIDDLKRIDAGDDPETVDSIASDLDWFASALDDAQDYIDDATALITSYEQTFSDWSDEVANRLECDEVKELGEIECINKLKGEA